MSTFLRLSQILLKAAIYLSIYLSIYLFICTYIQMFESVRYFIDLIKKKLYHMMVYFKITVFFEYMKYIFNMNIL